jgi:hypothetical protein
MRRELSEAAAGLFAQLERGEHELTADDREELIRLAVLVARCRSAVERDTHSREIELVPEPEAPARLVKSARAATRRPDRARHRTHHRLVRDSQNGA